MYYSGTPLNGHPSTGNTHDITDNSESPDCPSIHLVEHAVQTFKQGIKRLREGTVQLRLSCLVEVQTHTATTIGCSPAELLGRQPRSQLDLLHPDVSGRVQGSQARQQRAHDRHARARAFQVGDRVYERNLLGSPEWMEGTVLDKTGPVCRCSN